MLASGSASATWISVRCLASGVRSSCDALRDEQSMRNERRFEPIEQPVERVAELAEFIVGAVERKARVADSSPRCRGPWR